MTKTFTSALALVMALGGSCVLAGSALADPPYNNNDKSICYKVLWGNGYYKNDTNDRLFLDIKKDSNLAKNETAYSVHGKFVDAGWGRKARLNMNVATGTVVTKDWDQWSKGDTGARLGVETAGGLYKTSNHTFDCTNGDAKATPQSWDKCALDGKEGYSLSAVDPQYDDNCNFFQDGNGGYGGGGGGGGGYGGGGDGGYGDGKAK